MTYKQLAWALAFGWGMTIGFVACAHGQEPRVGIATGAVSYCGGGVSHPCAAIAIEGRASVDLGPARVEATAMHSAGVAFKRSLDLYQYGGIVSAGGELRALAGGGFRQYRTFVGAGNGDNGGRYLYSRGLYLTVGLEWSRQLAELPLGVTVRGQVLRATFPTRITDGTRTLAANRTDPYVTIGIDWRP